MKEVISVGYSKSIQLYRACSEWQNISWCYCTFCKLFLSLELLARGLQIGVPRDIKIEGVKVLFAEVLCWWLIINVQFN